MKNILYGLLIFLLIFSCKSSKSIHLFNGKNLNGWHQDVPIMDSVPSAKSPFIVRNGNLVSLGEPRGHLISNDSYKNYRLEIEYRFVDVPGNFGVLVHVSTPRMLYKMFPKSIEVQMEHKNAGDFWVIGEDIRCDNMEARRGPKETWGHTEGANRRILNLTDDSEKELGKWNHMVIECIDKTIKVWVNGDLVNYGYEASVSNGQIAIQSEGAEAEIRTFKMVSLNK